MSEDRRPKRATDNKEYENEEYENGIAPNGMVKPSDPAAALDTGKSNDSIVQSASLFLLARRILMTSLGAIALTFEETNDFIERLVERGEIAEQDINALVDDVAARAKGTLTRLPELPLLPRAEGKAEERDEESHLSALQNGAAAPPARPGALGERVEGILGRLNVPSRGDIETLTRKIDLLSGKVQLLKGQGTRAKSQGERAKGQGPRGEGEEAERNAEATETTETT